MRLGKFLLIFLLALPLAGCIETEFDFKTVVKSDGSVTRNTAIDGRGAKLFKVPGGEWKSRTWETRGTSALFPDTYHHIRSQGFFPAEKPITSDYEFDLPKLTEEWTEAEKKKLEDAGVKQPFENSIFSRNKIEVQRFQGFFTVTYVYEETFQNVNVVPLLMMDLKQEVKAQSEGRGQSFQDSELEELARVRLEDEILPQIRFKSEIELPGKIISTNGKQEGERKAVWKFSLRDFQGSYSVYTLRASSRMFRPLALLFFGSMALLLLVVSALVIVGMSRFKPRHYDDDPKKR